MKHPYRVLKMIGNCHCSAFNPHASSYELWCAACQTKLYPLKSPSCKSTEILSFTVLYSWQFCCMWNTFHTANVISLSIPALTLTLCNVEKKGTVSCYKMRPCCFLAWVMYSNDIVLSILHYLHNIMFFLLLIISTCSQWSLVHFEVFQCALFLALQLCFV